jgi:hypothetical protein
MEQCAEIFNAAIAKRRIKKAVKKANITVLIAIFNSMPIGMLQLISEIITFSLLRQKRLKSRPQSIGRRKVGMLDVAFRMFQRKS